MTFARCKNSSGVSLVEFIIALPVFLGLIFGIIDLSSYMIQKMQIDFAAEEALRAAIVSSDNCHGNAVTIFQTEMEKIGVSLSSAPPELKKACSYYTQVDEPTYNSTFFAANNQHLNLKISVLSNCYICNIAFGFSENLKTIKKTYTHILDSSSSSGMVLPHPCFNNTVTEDNQCPVDAL